MSRRTPRRHAHGEHAHPAQAANHCRAVVRVDGTGIRKKIKKAYEKALRDLDNSRQVVDQFLQKDQPQFARWLNSHFGLMLTELRELNQKLAAEDAIVFLVENEVMFGGGSHARAYKRVMEFRENPEPPPSPLRSHGKLGGKPDLSGSVWGYSDDESDQLMAIIDEMFGELGPSEDLRRQRDCRVGRFAENTAQSLVGKRLKELYRAVVRHLHPDTQREMTAQKVAWWHQARAAYEAGDAEQLEIILTLCEIGESGTTEYTSVSLLQRITEQLKNSLHAMKRQITQWRRDPAWNFSGRMDLTSLTDQVRRELMDELMAMRLRWRDTQEMIAKWKSAAEKLKPSRRRESSSPNLKFPF
jgi:hypothetical protein